MCQSEGNPDHLRTLTSGIGQIGDERYHQQNRVLGGNGRGTRSKEGTPARLGMERLEVIGTVEPASQ